jgi:hypothetical protein
MNWVALRNGLIFFVTGYIQYGIVPCDAPFDHRTNGDLFSTCHPVKIMTDQVTDQSTNHDSDNDGDNRPCGKITNAQPKRGKKCNEDPRTSFAFSLRRRGRLTILGMVMFFMAVVTACHFFIFWGVMILQS